MLTFKQFLSESLLEKASPEAAKAATLFKFVQDSFDVAEIVKYRGKRFKDTGFYQVRFKAAEGKALPPDIMSQLAEKMSSADGKKFGFSNVKENARTGNSGKYVGTTFEYQGGQYEYVLGQGSNKGESFETELLAAMQDYIDGEFNELAQSAFDTLSEINKDLSPDNVKDVKKRSGRTQRSMETKMSDVGKIVADIIIVTMDGDEHYISVKNTTGKTVANIGIAKALTKDLKIDTATAEYKNYIELLGLDVKRIEDGLQAYVSKKPIDGSNVDDKPRSIKPNSPVMKMLKKMWGTDYIYLRQKGNDFTAMDITEDYLDSNLLSDLKITKIRYPNQSTKQTTVTIESAKATYEMEYRSTSGGFHPLQVQLRITKSKLDEQLEF